MERGGQREMMERLWEGVGRMGGRRAMGEGSVGTSS